MTVFFNQLQLERFPKSKDTSLKAWNAADEYLLEWTHQKVIKNNYRVMIVNDQFGALSCSFSSFNTYYWTDSFLSKTAIEKNLKSNQLNSSIIHVNQCDRKIEKNTFFDLVVIRIPKHNSLLAFQLNNLLPHMTPATIIIAGGMCKEIHQSTLKLFSTILGPTKTSLAKKKARLIFPQLEVKNNKLNFDDMVENSSSEYRLPVYLLSEQQLIIKGLAGVFSRERLDQGCRLLLQHLPVTFREQKLIDLACGTGVLGVYAKRQNHQLKITFTDESWLAIESAKRTWQANINDEAYFKVTNVMDGLPDKHYDHILCNPPFHQQNVQTLSIANKMFRDAAIKLKSTGELHLVANRHLKYGQILAKHFKKINILSKHPKFIVWRATNPR